MARVREGARTMGNGIGTGGHAARTIGRRRVLGAGALGVGSLAFLAACRGSDDGGSGSGSGETVRDTSAPSTLGQLQDTSAGARPGGIYQFYSAAEIDSLDALPAPSVNTARTASGYIYSRLLKF